MEKKQKKAKLKKMLNDAQNRFKKISLDDEHENYFDFLFDANIYRNELNKSQNDIEINVLKKINNDDCFCVTHFVEQLENGIFCNPSRFFPKSLYLDILDRDEISLDLNCYTLFDPIWYSKRYLQEDIYKNKPLLHYSLHGYGRLDFSPIFRNVEIDNDLREIFDKSYADLYRDKKLDGVLRFLREALVKKNLENCSIGTLLKRTPEPLLEIFKFLSENEKLNSLHSLFCDLSTNNCVETPKWFDADEIRILNPDISHLENSRLFYLYLSELIGQQRSISRKFLYAPKNIEDLYFLVKNTNYTSFEEKQVAKENNGIDFIAFSLVFFKNSDYEIIRCVNSILKSLRYLCESANKNIQSFLTVQLNSEINKFLKSEIEKLWGPNVSFIGSGINVGFGSGHNAVFAYLKNKLDRNFTFTIVNPDGFFHPDALIKLNAFISARVQDGVYEFNHMPIPHPKFYNPITGQTAWFSGAAVAFHDYIYQESGGFDKNIFLYCEDVELSIRINLLGYPIYMIPDAYFWHDSSYRPGSSRYQLMLSSAMYVCKKYNLVADYINFFKQLSFQNIDQTNLELVKLNLRKPNEYIPMSKKIFFSDFHFGKSRKFVL